MKKILFSMLIRKSLVFYSILFLFFAMFTACLEMFIQDSGEEYNLEADGYTLTEFTPDESFLQEDESKYKRFHEAYCLSGDAVKDDELCQDDPDGDRAILDRTTTDYLEELLGPGEDAPGWPTRPWRGINVAKEKKFSWTVSFGQDFSLFDIIKLGAKTSIDHSSSNVTTLMLIKTANASDELIQKVVNGKVYLKVDEGVEFVGRCNYDNSASVGNHLIGNLKVLGVEIGADDVISDTISAYHTSNFFEVKEGDTQGSLFLKCQRAYEKMLKKSLANELELAVRANTEIIDKPVDNFRKAIDIGLYGPEPQSLYPLKIDGQKWHPKPITWYRPPVGAGFDNSSKLKIKGLLIHINEAFLGWGKDHKVYYSADLIDGKIKNKYISIGHDTSGWKHTAHRIVNATINDAAIEFNAEVSELDPGKKDYVTFYEHDNYGGKSLKLGVGQYANRYFPDAGWNDKISSIDIPPGFVVSLYRGDGLREWSGSSIKDKKWVKTQSFSSDKYINDQISGVQIQRAPGHYKTYRITNKFLSSNLGNNFKVEGALDWQIKYIKGGYYRFITKKNGIEKCLTYNLSYDLSLRSCAATARQAFGITEIVSHREDQVERGLYEITTKKGYRQIALNRNALGDGKQLILKPVRSKGDKSEFWSFTNKAYMKKGLRFVQKSSTESGKTEVQVLSPSTHYENFKIDSPTLLGETGNNWDFISGDYNRDGHQDLIGVKKASTGSGKTEVHILDGKSNFKNWVLQEATPLPQTDSNWAFVRGDYNRDGYVDVIGIKQYATGSNMTEVHVLDGKNRYKNFNCQTATALQKTNSNWAFASGDYNRDGHVDIIAIKKSSTGSGKVEVYVLDGKNKFKSFLLKAATRMNTVSGSNFDFISGDFNHDGFVDIVAIKKYNTMSGSVEVSILNGSAKYGTYLFQSPINLDMYTDKSFEFLSN